MKDAPTNYRHTPSIKRHIEGVDLTSSEIAPSSEGEPDFIALPYNELKKRNDELRIMREEGKGEKDFETLLKNKVKEDSTITAVTVAFTNMEGKLQLLDYDKENLLNNEDNLTFDGSSIKGFSELENSDLRLKVDWSSFRWLPAGVFGAGKVMMFANVLNQDGTGYQGDFRSRLFEDTDKLKKEEGITISVAPEIEGFLFDGENAEEKYDEVEGFELASQTSYFNSKPGSVLRTFIDTLARATRAMGFVNEKDHGEVAPSQFELNYKYIDAKHAADQIQLYKVTAQIIAEKMGLTASFLPKPIADVNGNGMHINLSLNKEGKNLFWNAENKEELSEMGRDFVAGILTHGKEMCLAMNSSVNAYRRLDPNFEAPNEVIVDKNSRRAMVRVPLGNEKSRRIEVRTVAPDANPYMVLFLLQRAGLKAVLAEDEEKEKYREALRLWQDKLPDNIRDIMDDLPESARKALEKENIETLPKNIQDAVVCMRKSEFAKENMGAQNVEKFTAIKLRTADRSPREFPSVTKDEEVHFHHEVVHQSLWEAY